MTYDDRIKDVDLTVRTGVYFLFKDKILIYVGVACNIAVRLWQHKLSKKLWDSVKWIEEKDYYKAIQIENYYLDKFNPKYNKAGSKLKQHEGVQGINTPYNKKNYPSGWERCDHNKLKDEKKDNFCPICNPPF